MKYPLMWFVLLLFTLFAKLDLHQSPFLITKYLSDSQWRCSHVTYRPSFVSSRSSFSCRPRGSLSTQRILSESADDYVSVTQLY